MMSDDMSSSVTVMKTIKEVLQIEARSKKNREPEKTDETEEVKSQYELLKLVFATDLELGKAVIDIHMFKHPVAMEHQRALYTQQPGLFSLLIYVTTNRDHPLRNFNEFAVVRLLMDEFYPTISNTFEEVVNWAEKLELALLGFLHCILQYEKCKSEDPSGHDEKFPLMFSGINPALYSAENVAAAKLITCPPIPLFRIGAGIVNIDGILVHGAVQPHQVELIKEIAVAHKYFLGRKITIMKNLEPDSRFAVGMYNVMTKVKETPFMCIGYRINEEDTLNIPEVGMNFSDIVPVICIDPKCRQGIDCVNSMREHKYIYIKTSTVHLEKPPLAAANTVDFAAMKTTWMNKALMSHEDLPAMFDQLAVDRENMRRFRKRKGTDCNFRIIWEESYLRYLVREFREKSKTDDDLLQAHMVPVPLDKQDPAHLIRLEDVLGYAYTLFMPIIYLKL